MEHLPCQVRDMIHVTRVIGPIEQTMKTTTGEVESKPRNSRVREVTGRRILDAATHVFTQKGFADATIAEMVQRSEVARGTFYLYYTDKRAVFDALVQQVTEDLYKVAVPPESVGSYRERIRRATGSYLDVFTRHAGVISCIFEVATSDREINRLQNGYREKFRKRIEAHFDRNVRAGTFRDIDPRTASYCLCAMIEGTAYEWSCTNYKPWGKSQQGLEKLADTLTDIWCRYVEPEAEEGKRG